MISAAAHTSLLPIAIIFVLVLVASRLFGRPPLSSPSTRSVVIWLIIPVMAAGICTAALNLEMGLGFKFSPGGNNFLLGRLFSDGLAADFLHDNCAKQPFIACRYLANLPRSQEEFLFRDPLIRDLKGHEDETAAIVRGTLLAHPLKFAASSAKGAFFQLVAIRTGDEIRSYGARGWNNGAMQRVFPGEFQAFSQSKQMRGSLLPLADAVSNIHVIVFWLSVAACLLIARNGRFGRVNEFLYSAIAFLVINASICATFSGVYDRYQSRVAWILPFCLTVYIYHVVNMSRGFAAGYSSVRLSRRHDVAMEPIAQGSPERQALDVEPDAG